MVRVGFGIRSMREWSVLSELDFFCESVAFGRMRAFI